MQFGPQTSYRLGDFLRPRNDTPDGDYVVVVQAVEAAQTQDGKPQVKIQAVLPATGKPHTWFYNINRDYIWALVQDLVTAGVDPNIEVPEAMLMQAEPWVAPMRQFLLNGAFNVRLKTNKNDYQNTSIRSRVQVGPDGNPTIAPAAASAPPQPVGNGFQTFGHTNPAGGANPWGGAPPMHPHTGPNQTMASAGGAPPQPPPAAAPSFSGGAPTGHVNVNDLFRQG